MNTKSQIKVVSIEGRWGQTIYPQSQKSVSVSELLTKEQQGALRPRAASLLSGSSRFSKNRYYF